MIFMSNKKDKFKIYNFQMLQKRLMLYLYYYRTTCIKKYLRILFINTQKSTIIIIAHGYSIYFKEIKIDKRLLVHVGAQVSWYNFKRKFIKNRKF